MDASEAGAGNLEVVVRCAKDGHRISNYLEAESKDKFTVYFTPKKSCCRYEVFVTFNDELVSGIISYFMDGSPCLNELQVWKCLKLHVLF